MKKMAVDFAAVSLPTLRNCVETVMLYMQIKQVNQKDFYPTIICAVVEPYRLEEKCKIRNKTGSLRKMTIFEKFVLILFMLRKAFKNLKSILLRLAG